MQQIEYGSGYVQSTTVIVKFRVPGCCISDLDFFHTNLYSTLICTLRPGGARYSATSALAMGGLDARLFLHPFHARTS